MKVFTPLAFALFTLMISCKKDNTVSTTTNGKIAPDNFTYNTTKKITLNISLKSNDNQPLKNVAVRIYRDELQEESEALLTAITDNNGQIKTSMVVPDYLDTLYVDPAYVGLIRYAKSYIKGTDITCAIGGSDGYSGNIVAYESKTATSVSVLTSNAKTTGKTVYAYLGSYDAAGVPSYLEPVNDVISSALLEKINASVPERQPLTQTHPSYLNTSVTNIVSVTALADVFVTFVSEGAGNLNTLGYYSYPTNNPPANTASIDTIKYIFPNSSASGSGGGLVAGNKVKIGRFPAGTSIGFVLFPGWSGSTKTVNSNQSKFFTHDHLNPENNATNKRHHILLYDDQNKLFMVGFEDLNRETSGCDNDFNDLVFYCSSNPVTAISSSNIEPIDVPTDSDNDGVSDAFDKFPNDASKAYISYIPSETGWGTLAFEDLWPDTGDYDMNDLVINYRYGIVSNASNGVVALNCSYQPIAAGASWDNGFGVQFPFNSSIVASVTGQNLKNNYIQSSGNGTEAGQTKTVIIPFDNYRNVIENPGGAYFINTLPEMGKVTGETVNVTINFTNPVTASTIGSAPFNPFLISKMRREFEVHLPYEQPTDKFNKSLFGAGNDNSSLTTGKTYLSNNNWPWAIHFIETFTYPSERNGVQNAYNHFLDWTASGGNNYKNWYSATDNGYRNISKLYTK